MCVFKSETGEGESNGLIMFFTSLSLTAACTLTVRAARCICSDIGEGRGESTFKFFLVQPPPQLSSLHHSILLGSIEYFNMCMEL